MTEFEDLPPPRRWPLLLAGLAGLLWLVLAAIAVIPSERLPAGLRDLAVPAYAMMSLAGPLAVILFVAARLTERSGERAARVALMDAQGRLAEQRLGQGATALAGLEARLVSLVESIQAVAVPIDRQHAALHAAANQFEVSAARLVDAGGRTEAAGQTLLSATPEATAQAERLTALLGQAEADLQRQLGQTEAVMAKIAESAVAAGEAARATTAQSVSGLASIADASRRAQEAVAAPLAELVAGVDTAFTRTAAAMDATRDGVHAQTNALLASVDQARVTLDHIGGEASRQITARLDGLRGTASLLGEDLDAHGARAHAMIDDIARGFTILDAKLGNATATGNTALDGIAARMTDARESIHRLGEPLAATYASIAALESLLQTVGNAADTTIGALDTALPEALPRLDALAVRLGDLHDRADALASPLAIGGDTIATAHGQLEAARTALDAGQTQLGHALAEARDALAEIEVLTGSAALAASSQLIDVFARVKDVANQTAGTMRDTLEGVVAEADAALNRVGTERAETAFGAPIRARLGEVEALHDRVAATAQAAAERITARLLALTETVAGVEARIDEADVHFEVRARGTLANRSAKLLESMQAAAIDIAGLLNFQVEDTAWDDYLKGDRSIFARRIVEQLGDGSTRAIARHFQHDPEFRTQATHYIAEFETLIAQVHPDREGKALGATLLSSNLGRLYVALAQGARRLE